MTSTTKPEGVVAKWGLPDELQVVESSESIRIETYEAFFQDNYRSLVGLAYVLTGRWDLAEDLAQEALAAAYKSWDRVAALDSPGAWVRRVVANRSVSLRRRRRWESGAADVEEGSIPAPTVESEDLWRLVRQLPKQQAIAVALRYLDDLTLAGIASVMGCSISTANTHLRRAHEKLAAELGTEWKEEW